LPLVIFNKKKIKLTGRIAQVGTRGMGFKSWARSNLPHVTNDSPPLQPWLCGQSRGDGHRSLVTHERVLSEYNKDLIFVLFEN